QKIATRMSFLQARVTATLNQGQLTIASDRPVTVPITGLRGAPSENYGGQFIGYVDVPSTGTTTVTVPPPPGALPAAWDHRDVGAVGVSGSAGFDAATNTYTVTGAGADVWGTADAFHFAYIPVDGDFRVTARVASVQAVAAWVKAGGMLRASLDPSSAQRFMLVSAAKGRASQRRPASAGLSTSTAAGT